MHSVIHIETVNKLSFRPEFFTELLRNAYTHHLNRIPIMCHLGWFILGWQININNTCRALNLVSIFSYLYLWLSIRLAGRLLYILIRSANEMCPKWNREPFKYILCGFKWPKNSIDKLVVLWTTVNICWKKSFRDDFINISLM